MTNSTNRSNASVIINEVLELMNERTLVKRIDEPIEKSAANFTFDKKVDITQTQFIKVTSRFVGHIYQNGLPLRQDLSARASQTEAVTILEKNYQNPFGQGYHAAYLDAKTDLSSVLAQLCGLIIQSHRGQYLDWVISSRISRLNWHAQCRIVEALFDGNYYLPPSIAERPPALFVNQIPELIKNVLIARQQLSKQLCAITKQPES